ncbi:MAG: outer membrane beta-barrel protein [Pseudomonadota bacterium]
MNAKPSTFFLAAVAATAAMIATSSAQADGHASIKDAPGIHIADAPTWSGAYAGGTLGWIGSEADWSFEPSGIEPNPNPLEADSVALGVVVGYQHQFGNFVVGVEGGYTHAFDGGSSSDCPNAAFACSTEFEHIWTIGGRLGYATHGVLGYVTGGFAHTELESNTSNGALFDFVEESMNGYYIGGGAEILIIDNLSLGIEYRRYEFGEERFVSARLPGVDDRDVDLSADSVTARVIYRIH